jgi:hypothetical protein
MLAGTGTKKGPPFGSPSEKADGNLLWLNASLKHVSNTRYNSML